MTSVIEQGSFEEEANEYNWAATSSGGRKHVLILGDSISIGYTPHVQKLLAGKAHVVRPLKPDGSPENCGDSGMGVEHMDRWLGDTRWDVIHFNFGLHDLKRITPGMGVHSNDPTQPTYNSLEQYTANLDKIVVRLKQTGATLIFATTTPYPEGVTPSRIPADAVKYNEAALGVMARHHIHINDLYTMVIDKLDVVQKPVNVHFHKEGSAVLAKQVVASIQECDDQGLYHVLLLGDCITAGYVHEVQKLLGDYVSVDFIEIPKAWDRDLVALLAQIRQRRTQWDLIQFNYGLDALRLDSEGKAIIPLQEYNELIVSALKSLQSVSTHLVWATTTPVQDGVEGYVVAGEQGYNTNEMLIAELTTLGVTTNDLWEYTSIRKLDMLLDGNIEMNAIGYQMLGEVTAGKIREVLIRTYKAELPNVLLLGDSISGGYKMLVMNRLLGKANVMHGNTAFTSIIDWPAIVQTHVLDKEMANGRPFDIIHFNWGLHALKHIDDKGDSVPPAQGTKAVPIDRYEIELDKLIAELKKTKATLVWATTTPVTPEARNSIPGDEIKYNEIAEKVIRKNGILINDLHRIVRERMAIDEKKYKRGGLHYSTEGSELLAEQISQTILRLIAK
jgi:lysophospholipase L1-like esterase